MSKTITLCFNPKLRNSISYLTNNNQNTPPLQIIHSATVGRAPFNRICTQDPHVSSEHFKINKKSNGFYIKDLGSMNGTFLNGKRVIEACLNDQDVIRIGHSSFTFKNSLETSSEFISKSKNNQYQKTLNNVTKVAESNYPVIIMGPSGSGKEIIAQMIHKKSERKHYPIVNVNCSALSESLIESELFGHIKGSFTGASENRKGAFLQAQGGTLFLDEIGDLPLSLQPKLLRAIENNEIKPVGSDQNIKIDTRVICATHKNLKQLVLENKFRQDLYFRLNVLNLKTPGLRQRIEDFELLAFYFAKQNKISFSHAALQYMKGYSWPGNIRELKNFIAKCSVLYKGERVELEQIKDILQEDSPCEESPRAPTYLNKVKQSEKTLICQKLQEYFGNQSRAAADIGMPKSTLNDRIKQYGINLEEYKKMNYHGF